MISIHQFASGVIADLIRRQPASKERTAFAWQLAVGPALARVTTVELEGGVLTVRAADGRWVAEVMRARDVVLHKMQHVLGADQVTRLTTAASRDSMR
jgi:predicted nucleic acid-binding Zn ribbon protein